MACRYDESPEEIRKGYEREFLHNSVLAEIFCSVMKTLEKDSPGVLLRLHPEAQGWWRDHKKRDKAKLAEESKKKALEKAKKSALSKLTPAEKRALGISCRA